MMIFTYYICWTPYLPPTQVLANRLHLIGHRVVPSVLVQRESCLSHWVVWEVAASVPDLLLHQHSSALTTPQSHGAS